MTKPPLTEEQVRGMLACARMPIVRLIFIMSRRNMSATCCKGVGKSANR
jgi:hypothetical protein